MGGSVFWFHENFVFFFDHHISIKKINKLKKIVIKQVFLRFY